jgi:hypothetical protein
MGVTGGSPLGFDVGARGAGGTLKGLDLGVRGMRVGGQRKLKVPPELGYGDRVGGWVGGRIGSGLAINWDQRRERCKPAVQGCHFRPASRAQPTSPLLTPACCCLCLQGVGEVPPGATLDINVELLSIKQDARGYQVKLVEG